MLYTVTKLSQPFIHKFTNILPLESVIYNFHNYCQTHLIKYNPGFIVRIHYEFPNYYIHKYSNIKCAEILKKTLETNLHMKYNDCSNELLNDYTLNENNFVFYKLSMTDYTCSYNDINVNGIVLKVSTK